MTRERDGGDPTAAPDEPSIPPDVASTPAGPEAPGADRADDDDRGATGALLGKVLRTGVIIAGVLLLGGIVLEGFRGGLDGGADARERALASVDHPTTPMAIVEGLLRGESDALITVGLITLLATPIVRIIVAGLDFRRRGDRTFAVICATVLVLLGISFLIEYLN